MTTELLHAADHDLFDTDVRPFELLRLIEELANTLDTEAAGGVAGF
jgi:hypothetical protein